MILSRQLVSNNEGGKTMKEKLNAFIEDFKKEALLDVIKIELVPNPTVGITQSKGRRTLLFAKISLYSNQ